MSTFMERLTKRWQDAVVAILGVWLVLSPWVLGYAAMMTPAWNAYIVGVIIAVFAVAALVAFQVWETWAEAGLGAWLIISPWLLGFAGLTSAVVNQVLVGLVVAGLAIWSAWQGAKGLRPAS